MIRQERYSGSMERSFFVGENLTEEDIKASFHHGVLSLTPDIYFHAIPTGKVSSGVNYIYRNSVM